MTPIWMVEGKRRGFFRQLQDLSGLLFPSSAIFLILLSFRGDNGDFETQKCVQENQEQEQEDRDRRLVPSPDTLAVDCVLSDCSIKATHTAVRIG